MEHVSIVDSQRHELKHADTAALNQVWKSNGDGTSKTAFVDWSELTGRPASKGYTQVLYGASVAANQSPSATNTPIQLEFGSAQAFTDASLSVAGILTFNTSGYYLVDLFLQQGRATSTGQVILFTRLLYNGAQILGSNSVTLDANVQVAPLSLSIPFSVNAGDTLQVQLVRDSAGANDGGVFRTVPTISGWTASPSAAIGVYKLQGLG